MSDGLIIILWIAWLGILAVIAVLRYRDTARHHRQPSKGRWLREQGSQGQSSKRLLHADHREQLISDSIAGSVSESNPPAPATDR